MAKVMLRLILQAWKKIHSSIYKYIGAYFLEKHHMLQKHIITQEIF